MTASIAERRAALHAFIERQIRAGLQQWVNDGDLPASRFEQVVADALRKALPIVEARFESTLAPDDAHTLARAKVEVEAVLSHAEHTAALERVRDECEARGVDPAEIQRAIADGARELHAAVEAIRTLRLEILRLQGGLGETP